MIRLARLTTTTALATLIGSTPVLADVTADDVWDSYTAINGSFGLTTKATQQRTGNTLSIQDIKITEGFPFDIGSVSVSGTGFDLVENSDGTVAVKYPDNMSFAVALTLPDDLFITAVIDYSATGYSMVASGDPGNILTSYTAQTMEMEVTSLTLPDMPDNSVSATFLMTDVAGVTIYSVDKMLSLTQNFTAGGMAMKGEFTSPSGNQDVVASFSATIGRMKSENSMVLPSTGIDLSDIGAHLRDGMVLYSKSEIENSISENRVMMEQQVFSSQKTIIGTTTSSVSISQDGVDANGIYTDYAIDYIEPLFETPVQLNFERISAEMAFPLLKSDSEQKLSYFLWFSGMTISDEMWSLFDPTGGLPRDPASMALGLSGKGRLFVDLVDFDALQDVFKGEGKFGEITSLAIHELKLAALDARLRGAGAFTFDNDNLETYPGLPAPSGDITFNIVGLDALIDKLIVIGLLDDDTAMGVRMGLGLFMIAGEGEDTLVSEIIVTPDGQITANGKRLK